MHYATHGGFMYETYFNSIQFNSIQFNSWRNQFIVKLKCTNKLNKSNNNNTKNIYVNISTQMQHLNYTKFNEFTQIELNFFS